MILLLIIFFYFIFFILFSSFYFVVVDCVLMIIINFFGFDLDDYVFFLEFVNIIIDKKKDLKSRKIRNLHLQPQRQLKNLLSLI